ncbi:MAG: haloacid dehalogenase [Anaerolineae bacterium]
MPHRSSQDKLQAWLDELSAAAQADLEARNQARDEALNKSRELIRLCSSAIRAGHRDSWNEANDLLTQAEGVGREMQALLAPFPDLFYAGYTQDALKELVEARITLALISDSALPALDALGVPYDTCLNGVCEAASELRRRCLDVMRQGAMDEAERLLAAMDAAYEVLMSFSYPDAITGGLRHRVDQLRGVLERTRGDLTNSVQMQRLLRALEDADARA